MTQAIAASKDAGWHDMPGGVMALLLWIDLSGCIVIFGACLCAAQAEWLSGAGRTDPPPAGSMLGRHP